MGWRAAAFADQGADALFIDALRSKEEMRAFCKVAPGVPKMANMLEGGGSTPIPRPHRDLQPSTGGFEPRLSARMKQAPSSASSCQRWQQRTIMLMSAAGETATRCTPAMFAGGTKAEVRLPGWAQRSRVSNNQRAAAALEASQRTQQW